MICAGPDHRDHGAFCPAPGHQIGFNDLKTIEVKVLIEAVAGGEVTGGARAFPDFREANEIERVVDAVRRSSAQARWISVR